MRTKVVKSDAEWRKQLTPEQYHVTREKGTERAFTGEYAHTKDDGVYRCSCCGAHLFSSDTKFESGTGWPSFYAPISEENVGTEEDNSFWMRRPKSCAIPATLTWAMCSTMAPHRPASDTASTRRR